MREIASSTACASATSLLGPGYCQGLINRCSPKFGKDHSVVSALCRDYSAFCDEGRAEYRLDLLTARRPLPPVTPLGIGSSLSREDRPSWCPAPAHPGIGKPILDERPLPLMTRTAGHMHACMADAEHVTALAGSQRWHLPPKVSP